MKSLLFRRVAFSFPPQGTTGVLALTLKRVHRHTDEHIAKLASYKYLKCYNISTCTVMCKTA